MKINKAIIKIVGVVEFPKNVEPQLKKFGYEYEDDVLKSKVLKGFNGKDMTEFKSQSDFYKNTYYPEIRKMIFLGDEKYSSRCWQKEFNTKITFYKGKTGDEISISAHLLKSEIFLFPSNSNISMFSIELMLDNTSNLIDVSNISFLARNFNSTISFSDNNRMSWISWIEKYALNNVVIHGEKVSVDDYSGSKFKVYTIVDLDENITSEKRANYLYDIGCGVPLETAKGNNSFTPSESYYETIMEKSIRIFNNWDALPLFDSFTVIGNGILRDDYSIKTYSTIYFRLYLFNLFFKYNLFRFNTKLHEGTVKVRSEFEDFINTYNISHVSFNFLPNEIYFKIREVLEIDTELAKFQERIIRISTSIQESQQKKTNLLLGLVSFITGLSGISPVVDFITNIKAQLGWNSALFFTLLLLVVLVLATPIFYYLFPDKFKKIFSKPKN
jgi:hypothetical protein